MEIQPGAGSRLGAGRRQCSEPIHTALLDGRPPAKALVADRGYDAKAIVEMVQQHGCEAHIPTQRGRKVQRSVDPILYRQRNLIERFSCKLKHFRRVATRFDKLARSRRCPYRLIKNLAQSL